MSIKEFIYFNKKKIILFVSLIIIFLVVIGYFYYSKNNNITNKNNKNDFDIDKDIASNLVIENTKEEVATCFFDIKGEVNTPGVYSTDCDKRIVDAIEKAGGLTKNADTSVLNLSKKIEDGMVILVYSKKEVSSYLESIETNEKKQSICENSNIINDACDSNSSNSSLININTASLNELTTLTGIGEAKAKNIIAYREVTPFKTIEDILNVEGIGESIYVNIKENITV